MTRHVKNPARRHSVAAVFAIALMLIAAGCSGDNGVKHTDGGPPGKLYVLNQGDATLYVYDTQTLARIDSINTVVRSPHYIEFAPDGRYFYVTTLESTGHIAKFDAATDDFVTSIAAPPAVQPTAIAITTDGRYGYICNFSLPGQRTRIHKFDLSTMAHVSDVQAGSVTHDVKMTSDGSVVVACNMNTDDITLVFPDVDTVAFVNVDPDSGYGISSQPKYGPMGVVIDHKDSLAFIACMNAMQVRVLDIKRQRVVDSIDIPVMAHDPLAGPTLLTISPDDDVVFLTTGGGNSLVAFRVSTKEILADIHLGTPNSFGIDVSDDGSRVYVACVNKPKQPGRVYIIDGRRFALVDSLTVGTESFGLTWRGLGQ